MKIPRWFFIALIISGLAGFLVSLYYHAPIRVPAPIGMPALEAMHYPVSFVKQLAGDPDAGRKIFKEYCASCHAQHPMIEVNAPLIGDKKAWNKLQRKGMSVLLKKTISGVGAMPARGGCFECSDEQLHATIQFILDAQR